MRRNAKERKKIKTQTSTFRNNDNEVMNFIKIVIVILIIVAAFTALTIFVTRDKKDKPNINTEIQYKKILGGSILSMPEESYYVIAYTSKDENYSMYEIYINNYIRKDEHLNFYFVDLEDGFNSIYNSEEEKLNVDKISDIRFKGTTVLKVENQKINKTITNSDEIEKYLKDLSA